MASKQLCFLCNVANSTMYCSCELTPTYLCDKLFALTEAAVLPFNCTVTVKEASFSIYSAAFMQDKRNSSAISQELIRD